MNSPVKQTSPVRRLIISEILIVVVLLLSAAVFGAMYAGKPEVEQKQTDAVRLNVDVFETQPIDFQELLTGFGTARADREVIVAAQVTGEIVEVHPQLKVGYAVTATNAVSSGDGPTENQDGDLLLRIDQRDFRERVDQASNRIEESRTEIAQLKVQKENVDRQLEKAASVLKTLKEEFDRIKKGVARKVSTPSELNRSLLEVQRYEDTIIQLESQAAALPHQIAAADQRLASSLSEKTRAENDLQRTEVRPPFNGVLSEVFVEQGRYVRAGEQLARLTDLTQVEVPISLSVDNFLQLDGDLAKGNRPAVTLAENETATPQWTGHVVRAAPEADPQSRTVQVFVEVSNAESGPPLLPGAFVHARIDGKTYESVVLVPREAIVNDSVYTVNDKGRATRKRIQPGRRLQSLVLVTEGLEPGEQVILTNLDIVQDGQEVVVQTSTGPLEEIDALRSPVL